MSNKGVIHKKGQKNEKDKLVIDGARTAILCFIIFHGL